MTPILLVEIISALVGLVCLGALTVRFICVRINRTQGSGAGRERARRHAAWGVGLVAAAAVHGASATLYACWSVRVRLGSPCLLRSLCREYDAPCAPQRERIAPRAPWPFYCGRHLLCGTRRCCAPLAATTSGGAQDSPTPSICVLSLSCGNSPRFVPRTRLPDKQRRQLVQALQDARAR